MPVISIGNASHYQWGSGCDGWRLSVSDRLSVIEERMPPGAAEVRHAHQHSEQFFYILLGTATIEIEGAEHTITSNEGVAVAPGRMHRITNTGAGELVFLLISSPPSQNDRIIETG